MEFRIKKIKNLILSFTLSVGMISSVFPINTAFAAEKQVDVMFVSDTHSHLEPFNTLFEGKNEYMGGFARLKTIINAQKEKNPETLILDGGDFSMGTMFHTLYESQASELRMIGDLGVEYTTMGNHEFDFGSDGLANMINKALSSKDKLPEMVLCNIDWEASLSNDGAKLIKDAFDKYDVRPYRIVEKNGVKIAVIGVFGKDALDCAPTCELKFTDPVEAVKSTIAEIKANEDADLFILLSHSGLGSDATTDIDGTNLSTSGESEDEVMAKSVPELNLIISGHSHTTVKEPLLYGTTYIVGCGEYTEQIGNISLTQNDKGIWEIASYELIATHSDVPEDNNTKEKIAEFSNLINGEYLKQFGYTKEQVLATNDIVFDSWSDTYDIHTESNLGDFISDAFRIEAQEATGEEIDMAVIPSGCIRETIPLGDVTVNDAFSVCSLGIGPDRVCGYPLVKGYALGKDIKLFVEVDASLSDYMHSARLYMSGLGFSYNPHRILLNKANDVWLIKDGKRVEIEDDKLYSIVADKYTLEMISVVTTLSKDMLPIEIKDENGNEVSDFNDQIIIENDGTELKAWEAIAQYMDSFEDNKIPQKYAGFDGRKVRDESFSPSSLLRNPNIYGIVISAVILLFAAIIIFLISLIVKQIKKRTKE